ncbi:MAG: choice-of-anchor B family protein [Candidatus Zixiibacteriota bacterium]
MKNLTILLSVLFLVAATAMAVPLDLPEDYYEMFESPSGSGKNSYNPGSQALATSYGFDSVAVFKFGNFAGSDCWGWQGPDGNEYAIMGIYEGIVFVDVTHLAVIDTVPGPNSSCAFFWRDIKTFGHYCYAVSECSGPNAGLMVMDMQYLPDSVKLIRSVPVNGIASYTSHNMTIDTVKGFTYVEGFNSPSVHIFDLADPENPLYVNSFGPINGIHDLFAHNDTAYMAEGSDPSFSIWDMSNKLAPVLLKRVQIPNAGYVHNIWPTNDGKFVATTEETAVKTVKIWNIGDLNNISLVGEYLGPSNLAHNAQIQDNILFLSHYESGVSAVDLTVPSFVHEIGLFDTWPDGDIAQFNGCWGVFPHTTSGNVYASNLSGELYILKFLQSADLPLAFRPNLGDDNSSHVVDHTPTFFWSFMDTLGAQAAFDIEVGSDADWSIAEMWVSGQIFGSDTSIVYAGSSVLTDGTTYYFRIRVNNGFEWGSWRVGRFTMNSLPTAPEPLTPIEQNLVVADWVELEVNNASDPEGDPLQYQFEVYSDPGLSNVVRTDSGVAEQAGSTKSRVFSGFEIGAEYWWRVRVFDGYEFSDYSQPVSFVTRSSRAIEVPGEQLTIQAAIDVAQFGDTVLLSPGTYSELIDFKDQRVNLVGDAGAEATIIQPPTDSSYTRLVNLTGGATQLEIRGITFAGVNAQMVLDIDQTTDIVISHNRFIDHFSSGGRTVSITESDAVLEHNLFANNQSLVVVVAQFGHVLLVNNTFDNNRIAVLAADNVLALNNIITNSSVGGLFGSESGSDYNNLWDNNRDYDMGSVQGPHDLHVDPEFVNADAQNYNLSDSSPCIDAGHPDAQYNDQDGSRNDIGAFPSGTSTDIPPGTTLPFTFALAQNYPNPFNPSTQIDYSLALRSHVRIQVYNGLGQLVRTIVDVEQPAGRYSAEFDGTDAVGDAVASGVYFYRITAGEFVQTRKMLLIK